MFSVHLTEAFKQLTVFIANMIPEGCVFVITDHEAVTWRHASEVFDVPALQVGTSIRTGGAPYQAIMEKRVAMEEVPREVYGMRLRIVSAPVFDGDSVVGAFNFVWPRLHPIGKAFYDFAPVIADMFPQGAFLYTTDLQKIGYRYSSKKFDISGIHSGQLLEAGSPALEAMQTKLPVAKEFDASVYGVPTLIMNYPLFHEDDTNQIVGTFGIGLPRQTALKLREMSCRLTRSMEEISTVVQQLAASSSHINTNEQQLNQNIKEIFQASENINEVLVFIKQIADETKMLGLNAAIEAARAGDVGRGFGVVAEEIRKLSDESKKTVVTIRNLTDRIANMINVTTQNSNQTLRSIQEQAAATQEVTASIQEISAMAEQLDTIAQQV